MWLGNANVARLAKTPEVILAGFLLLLIGGIYLRNPVAVNWLTGASILRTMALPGLVALGMVLLMVAGEIDLSTGAVISLTAVLAAWLMKEISLPVGISFVVALGGALLVGLTNAGLTLRVGINSLLVTLAMQFIVRGVSYSFTQGVPIYPLPASVGFLGTLRPAGLSVAFWLLVGLTLIVQVVLTQTRWGAGLYATGGNVLAAQICGVHTDRTKTTCFVLTSLLAGTAGLLLMSQMPLPSGDPIFGRNLELDIIVGVVVGGVSLFGGRGSAIGAFLGVLLMQVIRSGLVIARFDPYWQVPALGIVLLGAVLLDVRRQQRTLN
jgi:ribose transport system permease protein